MNSLSALFPVFCIVFFLASAGCNRESENTNNAVLLNSRPVSTTTVLSVINEDIRSSLDPGKPPASAVHNLFQVVFNDLGRSVAYIAELTGERRVVHNRKAGPPYQNIGAMTLSPDGLRIAYSAFDGNKWRMVIDGNEGKAIDKVGIPVFSPDSRHVAYSARIGERWLVFLDGRQTAAPEGHELFDVFFSSDSKHLFSIENIPARHGSFEVVKSDLSLKRLTATELRGVSVVYNKNRTRMALIGEKNGKKRVVELGLDLPGEIQECPLYDAIVRHAFSADGESVVYVGERDGKRFLALNGREEEIPKSDEIESIVVRPDKKGVSLILGTHDGYFLHHVFYKDEIKNKRYEGASSLVYNSSGSRYAYIAKKGKKVFIVVNGKEGPAFDTVVSPMFSPDGRYLVYRARKDGKRFVVVADAGGTTIRQHLRHEQVFPAVFTAEGKAVAYGVKDGQKLVWMVEKLGK